jgi:Histidine kinase-, DNA gyrase B-, and HSP90-like ATPase
MSDKHKYTMTLSLNVLNHLGINLYSNVPAVLSEAVANAWDAEAKQVKIDIDRNNGVIEITDDGLGMSVADINDKYLNIGYRKREIEGAYTPNMKRHVMGRKGIGKLSLFSIANKVEVHSVKDGEKNGLVMSNEDIRKQITENNGTYHPEDVSSKLITISKGTKIVLSDLKKRTHLAEPSLRKRVARRFSIIGREYKFQVRINGTAVSAEDRDFFKSIQFLWTIGKNGQRYVKQCKNQKRHLHFNGVVDKGKKYEISGWVGAVAKHNQLDEGNNKIVLMAWGKLIQEDILEEYKEGGLYSKYLIGEIRADFLDFDEADDITTSNRQRVIEDDPRYDALRKHIYPLLKEIQNVWTQWRKELATEKALENPVIKKWYGKLRASSRKHAQILFDKIESLPMDKEEDRKELYKYGILAFERLKVKATLEDLSTLSSLDGLKFASVFNDIDDIEAVLYFDIASERVKVIEAFAGIVDKNTQERVIQKYIFDHLWLLHPSWERATENARIEESVAREFKKVKLSKEERTSRLDIRYKTAAGKHIIIELKKVGRKVKTLQLVEQVKKYKDALEKCLKRFGETRPIIEVICLLGHPLDDDANFIRAQLDSVHARVILYDQLIKESLDGYGKYLEQHKAIAGLKEIIDSL